MSSVTRRHLLRSGAAVSASSFFARNAFARAAGLLEEYPDPATEERMAALAPRERLLLD
jgi:hypothetical protein